MGFRGGDIQAGVRRARRGVAASLALLALHVSPASAAGRRDIVLVGDSTVYGTAQGSAQDRYQPGAVLELLLRKPEPTTSPWRRARVTNLGVASSTTQHWLQTPPPGCGSLLEYFLVPSRACVDGSAWVDEILRIRPTADLVVLQLGLNDYLVTSDPAETADRLEQIRARLPVPVLIFPPVAPNAWSAALRAELVARGIEIPADYPATLPTFDQLHPTHGGYAAMAGLWLDRILKQP